MIQADFLIELFKLCKKEGIHIALDTSGFIFNEKAKQVYEYVDLVLLDIKHIEKNRYKDLTRVDLQPTLETMDYLKSINKSVWIRHVLVPGYSDDPEDLDNLAAYISKYPNVKRVDILPFHQMAIYKWEKVGIEYKLKDTPTPTREQIQMAEDIFKKYDLPLYKERD